MQCLLLIYGNEAGMQSAGKADVEQMMAAYGAYTEAMKKAGILASANRLKPSTSASSVRIADGSAAGHVRVTNSWSERTFVVVISPADLSGDLGLTVLWRSDVQRVMVTTVEAAIEVARVRPATSVLTSRRTSSASG